MNTLFDDLEEIPTVAGKRDTRQQFTCDKCAGSGRWHGGTNRHGNSACLVCRGKGFLLLDPAKRVQRARTAVANKAAKLKTAVDAFAKAHPQVFEVLVDAARRGTSEFLLSLHGQLHQRGELSERQVAAVYSGIERAAQRRAEDDTRRAVAPVVDLSPIQAMFEAAVSGGYKKPAYRAEGLVIKLAAATGANPGALYICSEVDEAYLGKLVAGRFHAMRTAPADTADKLAAIAADPRGAAVRHGQRTGRCSCCGRELTNEGSIEAGIGPICATKWGL